MARDPSANPYAPTSWGPPVRFNAAAGGKRWRKAVEAFECAQAKMMQSDPLFDPSGKVVSLAVARDRTGGLKAEVARRSETLRAAAVTLLQTFAPTPREAANKVLLVAWLTGQPDPRRHREEGNESDPYLAALFVELHCLDQYHDPDRFKRRKGGKA